MVRLRLPIFLLTGVIGAGCAQTPAPCPYQPVTEHRAVVGPDEELFVRKTSPEDESPAADDFEPIWDDPAEDDRWPTAQLAAAADPDKAVRRVSGQRRLPVPPVPEVEEAAQPDLVDVPGAISARSPHAGEGTSLPQLEELALSSNPTLIELNARIRAARGRWLQSGLKPNPVAGYSGQELGNAGTAGQNGAFLSQEVVRGDKLQLNRHAAAWDVKRARQELAAQRYRVLTDVRLGFYATRIAQERVTVAAELHAIAQQAVSSAEELVKVEEPRTVLTQAQVEAELASLLVENARTQARSQWRQLAAAIGTPDLEYRELGGELTASVTNIVWEEALERLQRESPELAASAASVQQARWALKRASAEPTSNLTLQGGLFHDASTRDSFASLQVSLPLPIHDRNQGGICEAHANVIAAEQAVQRTELELAQRLAAVYQQYEQSRLQAERYDRVILPKAQENLGLSRQSYQSGDSSYLAVLTAQRTYSQTKLAWLQSLEQLWSATTQIDGLLLSGSLRERSPAAVTRLPASGNLKPVGRLFTPHSRHGRD